MPLKKIELWQLKPGQRGRIDQAGNPVYIEPDGSADAAGNLRGTIYVDDAYGAGMLPYGITPMAFDPHTWVRIEVPDDPAPAPSVDGLFLGVA